MTDAVLDQVDDEDLARAFAIAQQLDRLEKTSPIDFYEPFPVQVASHAAPQKERWFIAGNRAGKTEWGGAECTLLVTGKAEWWEGPPHEVWCSTTTLAKSAEIQRPKVRKLLPPSLIKRWSHERDPRAESVLELTNGWVIRFKADQQGPEAFASGSAALVWHDEEPSPAVFDEARMRTLDCRGRIIVTFTPTRGIKWKDAHARVYKRWLAYREAHPGARWGAVSDNLFVATAATQDNPHVPPEEIEIIRKECAHRPTMLRVRLGGEWLDISEDAIVPIDGLRLWTVAPPHWRRKVGWIDPATSRRDTATKKREACEFAIAAAGMSPEGGLYLIDYRHGRYFAGQRMTMCLEFIQAHGLKKVFVQPVTGDEMFADHLNERLANAAIPCVVSFFEYEGGVPSKEERAEEFAGYVDANRVFTRPEHEDFRAEAGVFPHGATDDLFDACIGAIRALFVITDSSVMEEAMRQQLRTKRDRRNPDSVVWESGGERGILDERL